MTTYAPTASLAAHRDAARDDARLYRLYSRVYAALAVLVLAFLALVPVVAA